MKSMKLNLKSKKVTLQHLFMFMAAVMVASMTFTACDKDDYNGDDNDDDDDIVAQTVTYSGTKDGTSYTLKITEATRSRSYTGQSGDSYTLTASSKTSVGSVTSVNGEVLTLKPSNSSTTFSATTSGNSLTGLSGTITWNDNSNSQGPGLFKEEAKQAEWTVVKNSPAGKNKFNCIIFANDMFVAGADGGIIVYSKDGIEWKAAEPLHSTYQFINGTYTGGVNSIAYGNGIFVAVGGPIIWTSKDGISWQEERPQVDSPTNPDMFCPIHMTPGRFTNVAFGNGKFVVCMATYYNWVRLGWSTDGKSWNRIGDVHDDARKHPDISSLYGLTFFNGKFIISGSQASGDNGWMSYSENGWDWSAPQKVLEFYAAAQTAVGNNRILVANGQNLYRSTDGMTWTKSNPKVAGNIFTFSFAFDYCIAFGNGKWVGGFDFDIVYSTDNGDTWQMWERNPFFDEKRYNEMDDNFDWNDLFSYIYGMAYGKGRFVAVGGQGEIAYSPIQ